MREIKFRGKRLNGKLKFNKSITRLENGSVRLGGYAVIPETVGQFTGLTDKNGKKIFDDDIVKHRFKRVWKTEFHTSKVVWNNEYSCYYLFDGVSNYKMRDDMEYEVLGNIHNNPELL